jgi:predicted permease
LALVGRRKDGATLAQVRAELSVIAAQIDREQPGRSTKLTVERATPLSIPAFRGVAFGVGAILMTTFGLVLFIACANVANLLLARAMTRRREIAVRLSLGASRVRVVRQLLSESVLIAIAGGAIGSVIALWSFRILLAFALPKIWPAGIPPLVLDTSPDLRVLSFTFALSFGTAILFGLAPALHMSKPDLHMAMKQDSSGAGSRRGGRLQRALVGAQVAVCMVLMLGAGLLIRGLYASQTVDPDFIYRGVVSASYDLESAGYDADGAAVFQRRLLEQVQTLPGVESAALVWQAPLNTGTIAAPVRLPSQSEDEAREVELNAVTPGYFSLIGIPIVRGRTFTDDEVANDAPVVIVTEATARNWWPGQDPIGQALLNRMGVELRVVGVARDAQVSTLGAVDDYLVYLPPSSQLLPLLGLLAKSRSDFGSTAAGIRSAVRAIDPAVPVRLGPLEDNLELSRSLSALVTSLAALLGTLALVLASVGIYGVVSYFVGQRLREIGIRIALGARPRDVLGLIMRQTMRPVVIGAALGVAGAFAASGVLSSVLFGVSPLDPTGLSGAAAFVLCVALAAGVFAGRRAMRVDPMTTLRQE